MEALRAKRRATLALLALLFLLAVLSALRVSPWAAFLPLFLAVLAYVGYAQEAERVLGEEVVIPFYANAFVLGHQWKRVCRLRVSGSWARTRHRSATTSIISSRS
jgi:hypothetical protein